MVQPPPPSELGGAPGFLLDLSNKSYWEGVVLDVPCVFEVWQWDPGSHFYRSQKINIGVAINTADGMRVVQDVVCCAECGAVWPKIDTLGVVWATQLGLCMWSRTRKHLRCACCPVDAGSPTGPRSFVSKTVGHTPFSGSVIVD